MVSPFFFGHVSTVQIEQVYENTQSSQTCGRAGSIGPWLRRVARGASARVVERQVLRSTDGPSREEPHRGCLVRKLGSFPSFGSWVDGLSCEEMIELLSRDLGNVQKAQRSHDTNTVNQNNIVFQVAL